MAGEAGRLGHHARPHRGRTTVARVEPYLELVQMAALGEAQQRRVVLGALREEGLIVDLRRAQLLLRGDRAGVGVLEAIGGLAELDEEVHARRHVQRHADVRRLRRRVDATRAAIEAAAPAARIHALDGLEAEVAEAALALGALERERLLATAHDLPIDTTRVVKQGW